MEYLLEVAREGCQRMEKAKISPSPQKPPLLNKQFTKRLTYKGIARKVSHFIWEKNETQRHSPTCLKWWSKDASPRLSAPSQWDISGTSTSAVDPKHGGWQILVVCAYCPSSSSNLPMAKRFSVLDPKQPQQAWTEGALCRTLGICSTFIEIPNTQMD